MGRAVAHLDLDTFFVSCERLNNSKFNNLPLIVGGGNRGVVASCSYEARKFGVRSAMPMKMALRLCPQATVVKGDMELYSKKSREVTEILTERSPILEKASIDEFYLDLTGMDRFFGSYKWTSEVASYIARETGLPLSFALSVNKTVSKIATGEGKPLGRLEVPELMVRPFLDPLSVRKIPMVGESTYKLLSRIGVRQIRTLSEMPMETLQALLGKNGADIWKKANGIDNAPVLPYQERKSISTEQTFFQDTMEMAKLRGLLTGMVEKLCYQMRSEQLLTSCITVKLRYTNFDTETRQKRIAYTSADHVIGKIVSELFDGLYQRRMRLRLVGISFSGLVHGNYQIDCFEDTRGLMNLYQAMDSIKHRFGTDAVRRCGGMSLKNPKT
ncbi:DNA polymerase IV [Fluviicola sp.]|uniref:DNA polymerase IV n=1 Tax=Fluviicola sp. TaxID=1917219 RepID=UPI0031E378B4